MSCKKRAFIFALILSLLAGLILLPACTISGDDDDDNDSADDDTGDDDSGDDDSSDVNDCFNPPTEPPPGHYIPIGAWYHWFEATGDEAIDREYYQTTFAELAAHGIDLLVTTFVPPANRIWLLEEAEEQRIKVIMDMREMTVLVGSPVPINQAEADQLAEELTAPIRDMPALFGYYIADEPGMHGFLPENLGIAREAFEKADPEHSLFSCFFLWYLMGKYFKAMQPDILLTDIYPIDYETIPEDFINGWHIHLFQFLLRNAWRVAGGKPAWMVTQAFSAPTTWRMPIFEELRALTYLALNQGFTGIIYFCYQSVVDGYGYVITGLVDFDGQHTENYERMSEFHQELEPVKTALMWSEPVDAIIQAPEPFDLAMFRHQLGFHYVMAVNKDVLNPRTGIFEIPVHLLPNVEAIFDEASGAALPFENAGDVVRFSWTLNPGDGRMFRICTGEAR